MEETNRINQSFLKEDIIFGLKGEYNEVKGLKMYLANNPSAKIYYVERETEEDAQVGQKRKIVLAKYLEVRDKDGEDYKIILQIKISEGKIQENYPAVMVSKESDSSGAVTFKPVGPLKDMKVLERGHIDIIQQKEAVQDEEIQGQDVFNQMILLKKENLLLSAVPQNQTEKPQPIPEKTEPIKEEEQYVNAQNRKSIEKKLKEYIRDNSKNNLTLKDIQKGFPMHPKSEQLQMIEKLCYTEKTSTNSVIYKLKEH